MVDPEAKLVCRRRRKVGAERRTKIEKQVTNMLATSFIRKVKYTT